jgi:PPOX class probable F420-dependent enzyme
VRQDRFVDWVMERLAGAEVGRLATADGAGTVHLVPVCFAVVPGWVVSAVDHKPKRTTRLGRLRDIRETGRAVLLVDHYEDDWSQLWWIRVSGSAVVHAADDPIDGAARAALAAKYHQYRERPPAGLVWSVALDEVRWWSASEAGQPASGASTEATGSSSPGS